MCQQKTVNGIWKQHDWTFYVNLYNWITMENDNDLWFFSDINNGRRNVNIFLCVLFVNFYFDLTQKEGDRETTFLWKWDETFLRWWVDFIDSFYLIKNMFVCSFRRVKVEVFENILLRLTLTHVGVILQIEKRTMAFFPSLVGVFARSGKFVSALLSN